MARRLTFCAGYAPLPNGAGTGAELLSTPRVAGSFAVTIGPVGGLAAVPGGRTVFAVDQAAGTTLSALILPAASTLGTTAARTAVATASDAAGPPAPPSPDPLFDNDYDPAYPPDVAASGMNPLLHYVQAGQAEGRPIYPA